jgi:uncharacterized protein with beta-barrel porin domain
MRGGSVIAAAARWLTVRSAAALLDMNSDALRRTLERRARRMPDGGVEAEIDGVRARRFGRTWRVAFGERWNVDEPAAKTGS